MSVGLGNINSNKTAANLEWSDSMPTVQRLQMKCMIIARNSFMSKLFQHAEISSSCKPSQQVQKTWRNIEEATLLTVVNRLRICLTLVLSFALSCHLFPKWRPQGFCEWLWSALSYNRGHYITNPPTLKQCTITRKITENYRTFALFLHRKRGNLMTPVITLVMLFKQCRLVGLSVYSRVEKQNLCRNMAFVLRLYNNPHLLKAPKQEQCRTSIPTTLLASHWLPPRSSVCIIKLQANSMLLTFPSICLTNLTNVAFLENTDYPNK